MDNQVQGFEFFDLKADASQAKATTAFPEAEQQAKVALAEHLKETQRGYFNWDVKYAHTTARWINRPGDHSYDVVVNDLPDVQVRGKQVVVAPISKEFAYRLQGTVDGTAWYDIAEYASKQDAGSYTFKNFNAKKGTKDIRVQTVQHFGLPAFEHFGKPAVGELDAFLPKMDEVGDVSVENGVLTIRSGETDAAFANSGL